MSAVTEAGLYYRDLTRVAEQAGRLIRRLWRRVDPGDVSGSWAQKLPEAAAYLAAAQTVAAELADPYVTGVLADAGPRRWVAADAFAGATPAGLPLTELLYLPVIDAKVHVRAGASMAGALKLQERTLATYTATTVADAGRLAVATATAARPHAAGYYRMLQPPSCARCAILAGRFYRYNQGFRRHPRCDCVHIPVQEADDSLLFDARKAIEAGKVTGLSQADTTAIVKYGANPAQVVNAKRGTYLAGGRNFTTTGTTRKGVAGARILARDFERARSGSSAVQGRTFRNMTFDRQKALEAAELLRQGKAFTRLTSTGKTQSYAYRFTRSARPTPEQILADAATRDDAVRLLTNFGYIL